MHTGPALSRLDERVGLANLPRWLGGRCDDCKIGRADEGVIPGENTEDGTWDWPVQPLVLFLTDHGDNAVRGDVSGVATAAETQRCNSHTATTATPRAISCATSGENTELRHQRDDQATDSVVAAMATKVAPRSFEAVVGVPSPLILKLGFGLDEWRWVLAAVATAVAILSVRLVAMGVV